MFGRTMEGCLRCSMCAIHYPVSNAHAACDACGEKTDRFTNVAPDEDWEDRVKYAKMRPEAQRVGKDPHEHRFDQYLRMGFNEADAQLLASATWGQYGSPLWHETVRRALAAGCCHRQALEIFV